jgi:hypothetical protein
MKCEINKLFLLNSTSTQYYVKLMSFLDLKETGRKLKIENNFTNAIIFYLKAYELRSSQLGKQQSDHIDLVDLLHEIAECYSCMGDEHQVSFFRLKEDEMRTRLWYSEDNFELAQSLDRVELNAKGMGQSSFKY